MRFLTSKQELRNRCKVVKVNLSLPSSSEPFSEVALPKRSWVQRCFSSLGVLFASALVTVLGLLASVHWLFELFCYFTMLHLLVQSLGLVYFLFKKRYRWLILPVTVILINVGMLLPIFMPLESQQPSESTPQVLAMVAEERTLSIMQFNTWKYTTSSGDVAKVVLRENPDIVVFQEVSPATLSVFEVLGVNARYPYRYQATGLPKGHPEEMWVYSRYPADWRGTTAERKGSMPNFQLQFDIAGQPLLLTTLHTDHRPDNQRRQLGRITETLAPFQGIKAIPKVVLGDLNTAPWSFTMQQFAGQSGLRNVTRGVGWQGAQSTWPAWLPFISFDQVWVSPEFKVLSYEVLPGSGSDHRPVLVRLHLPASDPQNLLSVAQLLEPESPMD